MNPPKASTGVTPAPVDPHQTMRDWFETWAMRTRERDLH